jgi:hypothetical protein
MPTPIQPVRRSRPSVLGLPPKAVVVPATRLRSVIQAGGGNGAARSLSFEGRVSIGRMVRQPSAVLATAYTFTGPTTLAPGATGTYTLTANGNTTASVTISDGGAGGTIISSPVVLSNTTPATFTYVNNTPQTLTLTPTNSGGLANPSPIVVIILTVVTASIGTQEVGAGTLAGLISGASAVIIGPFQTAERNQLRITVHLKSTVAANLDYEYSTDKGTTWFIGQQVASHVTTADDGVVGYNNEATYNFEIGWWWRISVRNTAGGAGNMAFAWRLHWY